MICKIRKWKLSDAEDLAAALSNTKIQNNLRDGLPYPYTEKDGTAYIMDVLSADEDQTFAFAVTADSKVVGSIGVFRQENIHRQTGELGYCHFLSTTFGFLFLPRENTYHRNNLLICH